MAAGADAGDQVVEALGEVGEDLGRGGAPVDLDVRRVLELLRHPAPGVSATISLARAIAPGIPFSLGVSSSSAPYAAMIRRRSTVIDSGMTRISRYPFTAATMASPMPVLPDVGSMITLSGFSSPAARRPRSSRGRCGP